MFVSELWRYPVKSMGGERLTQANVTVEGITGDRRALVVSGDRIVTARTHPRLLSFHATVGASGEPLVNGLPIESEYVSRLIVAAAGPGTRIVQYDGPERFDVLPLLVATDGAIAALGEDSRRLRPNILIGGVDGLREREWEDRRLRIGATIIQIHNLRQRCVMTTYDPDTQAQNIEVLKKIVREFDGTMALNCSVLQGGTIRVGDDVAIFDP